jgi:hypothetical protein
MSLHFLLHTPMSKNFDPGVLSCGIADKIVCRSLPLELSMSLPANAGRRSFTFEKFFVISVFPLPDLPAFMRTILLV